jgi:FixJ family two-component response regulator
VGRVVRVDLTCSADPRFAGSEGKVASLKRRDRKSPAPVVYVVDDDPSIRRAVGRLMLSAHYDTELFASAEEFLAYARPARPACLVLDLWLPGMGGIELQRQLTEAGETLPVVVITGLGDEQLRQRALAGGALAVLDKPFEDEHLLGEVRRALTRGADSLPVQRRQ